MNRTLVNTLFMAFVGALALGVGLAFGLGGRETAAEILRNWYGEMQQRSGPIERSADAMRRVAENAGRFGERSPQLNPNPSAQRHPSEGG